MGTIKSKMGRKFEQKRKAKWVKKKANLVKAYPPPLWQMLETKLKRYLCMIWSVISCIIV